MKILFRTPITITFFIAIAFSYVCGKSEEVEHSKMSTLEVKEVEPKLSKPSKPSTSSVSKAKVEQKKPKPAPAKSSALVKQKKDTHSRVDSSKSAEQKKPEAQKLKPEPKKNSDVTKIKQATKPLVEEAKNSEQKASDKIEKIEPAGESPQDNSVVAQVNGQPISTYAFEKLLIEQLQSGVPDSVELRKTVRDELVIQTLLSQLAMEEGVDQFKDVELAFESARRTILSNAWRQNWAKENPVEEQEIRAEYNATIKKLGTTEYQLRQVVVADETAAALILDQLGDGKELGDLAYRYTIENGGKKSRGLLPWVSPSLLLPPIGQLISNLKVGELLPNPVRTRAGWHVVKLEGARPLKPPSIDQLRAQISRNIQTKRMTQSIQKLLDGAKINF